MIQVSSAAREHLVQSLRVLEGEKVVMARANDTLIKSHQTAPSPLLHVGLETATTRSERISVLKMACFVFDHRLIDLHDLEIEAGVAERLCVHLKRASNDERSLQEAERICKLLSMAYQCTNKVASASFGSVGFELVPCLFKIISKQGSTENESSYAEQLVERFSSIDLTLTSVNKSSDILEVLLGVVQTPHNGDHSVTKHALSLLVALASENDSKTALIKFPGLFDAAVAVASCQGDVETRYQCVRFLRELAWHNKNKVLMGQTGQCITSLVSLSDSIHENVRTEAFTALRYLAAEVDNKARLVWSADGNLIKSLISVVRSEDDVKARCMALELMLNLISRETFEDIVTHPGTLDTLISISCSTTESDAVAGLAAQSIKRLASCSEVNHKCYVELLHAMKRMSGCTRRVVLLWAAKSFLDQSTSSSNSFYIARDAETLNALGKLASSLHSDVKGTALETMLNLTDDTLNAKRIAENARLLEALVDTVENHIVCDDILLRRLAVRAILSLASHRPSAKRIAKQFGLVNSLARYGLSQDNDVELKRAALHGVLLLAPCL